ncbi:class I SAM-dependent methyltransferase [Kitasatospora sp. NPDC088346]|uniref:class I SAM-dependent methyltransferase n=1 Tax=Kitasatospora sp. NPDC088346 TaxID=3364073 RepID=UPI003802A8DC
MATDRPNPAPYAPPAPPGHPAPPGAYGRELFEPGAPGEAERIDYGAIAYDAFTRARLLALGARPGLRCLDVGAGTGTVSRWLAEQVGAEVLAVDRDPRFVEPYAGPRLRTLAADVTSADFDPGRFDLVHARFLLMHLPDSRRTIARLARLLVPGGRLVLGDAVDLTTAGAPDSPYRLAMRAMWRGLRESIGTDVGWTPEYPARLRGAGLTGVGAEVHVPPLTPGAPITAFWLDTWRRMRGPMLATGLVDERTLAAAERDLASPEFADLSPGMITAWGERPRGGHEED